MHLHLTLCLDLCRRKLAREARRAERRTGCGRLHQCELDSCMYKYSKHSQGTHIRFPYPYDAIDPPDDAHLHYLTSCRFLHAYSEACTHM